MKQGDGMAKACHYSRCRLVEPFEKKAGQHMVAGLTTRGCITIRCSLHAFVLPLHLLHPCTPPSTISYTILFLHDQPQTAKRCKACAPEDVIGAHGVHPSHKLSRGPRNHQPCAIGCSYLQTVSLSSRPSHGLISSPHAFQA
jgi:hypothetical protein